MTFDSLTFARRLKTAGFTEAQAEALADANREVMMPDLATKTDLTAMEKRFQAAIDTQTLRLTVRMGIMLAAGISLMTAIFGALTRFH